MKKNGFTIFDFIAVLVIIFILCKLVFADELMIPFSCYPKKIQAAFAQHNITLDLSADERNETSWGYIFSRGSSYSIFTYHALTAEELNLVLEIVRKEARDE